jgi:hypothetical protein
MNERRPSLYTAFTGVSKGKCCIGYLSPINRANPRVGFAPTQATQKIRRATNKLVDVWGAAPSKTSRQGGAFGAQ